MSQSLGPFGISVPTQIAHSPVSLFVKLYDNGEKTVRQTGVHGIRILSSRYQMRGLRHRFLSSLGVD